MASSDLQGELTEAERDLKELKESLRETQPVGPLVGKCRTLDQVIMECIFFFLFLLNYIMNPALQINIDCEVLRLPL